MKKVLFASTALVAFAAAGSAFAGAHEGGVSMSMSGEMGLNSDDGVLGWAHDFDIGWSASTVTDGGLTFSASGQADDETTPSISVAGGFGTVSFGDEDDALDAAMGGVDSGSSLAGAADNAGADAGVNTDPLLYTSPDLGGFTAYASVALEGNTGGDTGFGVGVSGAVGDITVGGGFASEGDNNLMGASAGLSLGGAAVKAAFQTGEVGGATVSKADASASVAAGGATVGAQLAMDLEASTQAIAGFATMDLGGNVTLAADAGVQSDETFDYGVSIYGSF